MRASILFAIPGTLAQGGGYFDYYDANDTINLPERSGDDDNLPSFGDFNYESESYSEGAEYFEITSYSGDEPEVSLGDDESQRKILHDGFNAEEEDDGTISSLVQYQIKKTKKRPSRKPKKQKLDKKQDNYQEIKYLESKGAQSNLPWLDMISHIHMVEIGNIGRKYGVNSKEMTKKLGNYGCWCSLLFPPRRRKKKGKKNKPVYEAPTEWSQQYKIPPISNEQEDGSFRADKYDSACEKLVKCLYCVEGKDFGNPHNCQYKGKKPSKMKPDPYDAFLKKENDEVEVMCMNDPDDQDDEGSECKRGQCECNKMFAEMLDFSILREKSYTKVRGYNKANLNAEHRQEQCVPPSPVESRNPNGATTSSQSSAQERAVDSSGGNIGAAVPWDDWVPHANEIIEPSRKMCCKDYPGTLGLYSEYNCCAGKAYNSLEKACCAKDGDHHYGKTYAPNRNTCCPGTNELASTGSC